MMPLPVEFHPEARAEANATRQWYADIEAGLAVAYAMELDAAIRLIASHPRRWTPHKHGTRCLFLRRFPYLVVYRELTEVIQVVAIQHSRRRPDYWLHRVQPNE